MIAGTGSADTATGRGVAPPDRACPRAPYPRAPRTLTRLLVGLLAPFAVTLLGAAAAGALEVRVEGEQLSADVSQEPVADVLAEVARQTGAKLTIRGDLGTVSRQAFAQVPLATGLVRLVQPNGLVLQFAPSEGRAVEGQATKGQTAGTSRAAASATRRLVAIRAVAPGAGGAPPAGVTPAVTRRDLRRGLPPGFWNYESGGQALPSVAERISALSKLRRQQGTGAQASAAPFVYVLVTDPDPAARRMALGMLAAIKSDDARGALTQAAADTDATIRADALRAIASSSADKPVSLLAQAGRGDSDPQVRITAIELLSLKDGPLAEAVIKGALADPDPDIRNAAQQAMRN